MSDSAIRDLLQRRWGLKPPTLIITVFGMDFEKKRKLKMIFKKGLWKAADSGKSHLTRSEALKAVVYQKGPNGEH